MYSTRKYSEANKWADKKYLLLVLLEMVKTLLRLRFIVFKMHLVIFQKYIG